MHVRRGFTHTRVVLMVALVAAIAAGVAYAAIPDANKVYTACMLNNVGTVRLIDPSLPSTNPMSHCTSLETQIKWNQQGQQGTQGLKGDPGSPGANGKDGVSVTSASLQSGDANCPSGGSSFTSASGTTYACNGQKGEPGSPGADGGVSGLQRVVGPEVGIGGGAEDQSLAVCPAGKAVLGGGFSASDGLEVLDSLPIQSDPSLTHPDTWEVIALNTNSTTTPTFVAAFAICADINE